MKILVTGGAGFTPVEQLTGLQNSVLSRHALSTGQDSDNINVFRKVSR